jgi:hypothetical protein
MNGFRKRDQWRTDYLRFRHDVKASGIHGWRYIRGRFDSARTPPLLPTNGFHRDPIAAEVHILTSYRDWQMAFWAIYSLISSTHRGIRIAIHDDGTLPEEAHRRFTEYFPDSRIVPVAEADSAVKSKFKNHKRLLHLRNRLKHFWKLTDFALFCDHPRMIVLDSDVLFFREPVDLLAGPRGSAAHLFMRDIWSTYESTEREGQGPPLADRICCGLGNVDAKALDFDRMESFLAASRVDLDRCDIWIEQTLWALECAAAGVEYLPGEYAMALGRGSGGLTAKHYIGGPSRDYFYIEGIDAVKHNPGNGREVDRETGK